MGWIFTEMLLDANLPAEVPADLSAGIVIVGAGTVGLYLASQLAKAEPELDILLVESGTRVADTASNASTSRSVGKPHEGVRLGRASGLGGTSALWGGQLAEFDIEDLQRADAWWPLTFEELRTHYRSVYQQLAIGTPAPIDYYRQRFGNEVQDDAALERFFTYWLKQPNFAVYFKPLIKSDPNVRVVLNLTASGMAFDGSHGRRLECSSSSGRAVTIRATRFVFASGTVATSRFFLSTQAVGNVPWRDNPKIGRYFQDHLGGRIAQVTVQDESKFRDYFENGWVGGIKLQAKLNFKPPVRRSLPTGACAFFTYESGISENLANLKRTIRGLQSGLSFSSFGSRLHDVSVVGKAMWPIVRRYLRDRRILTFYDRGIHLEVQAEQIPLERSCVRLEDNEPTADGLRPVLVDWQCDGRELEAIRTIAIDADAYLRTRGLAQLQIDPNLLAKDPAFIDRLSDTYHPCGGMRMSASASAGVVDGECKVWGTDNVWVAGASVLPSSSHANCTLTALALASRLVPKLLA
jgi:choline dehydrogenase-like flavoprotein